MWNWSRQAKAAGWGEDEIAEVLVELARCHRLAGWESQKSEAALDEAWEQIGGRDRALAAPKCSIDS